MATINKNTARSFSPHASFTRTHQICALALVVATFFLTRLLDRSLCHHQPFLVSSTTFLDQSRLLYSNGGAPSWPARGYGTQIALKIYIYEEDEVDGLKELMRGREGKISAAACVKGQWGTQVKIHQLLLKSKSRTWKKEEADLFFVPSYVKCVRMMGGLNDKEINQTYVKWE